MKRDHERSCVEWIREPDHEPNRDSDLGPVRVTDHDSGRARGPAPGQWMDRATDRDSSRVTDLALDHETVRALDRETGRDRCRESLDSRAPR